MRRPKSSKQVSFSMWMSGTRWGLRTILIVLGSIVTIFTMIKLGNDLGLDRYFVAHRGYVDDHIDMAKRPLKDDLGILRIENAQSRINEIGKQVIDIQIAKLKVRGTPQEVQLTEQERKLVEERAKLMQLIDSLAPIVPRR